MKKLYLSLFLAFSCIQAFKYVNIDELAPAIIQATQKHNLLEVKSLIESDCSVNSKDSHGFSALVWAIKLNHFDSARELIAAGANLKN